MNSTRNCWPSIQKVLKTWTFRPETLDVHRFSSTSPRSSPLNLRPHRAQERALLDYDGYVRGTAEVAVRQPGDGTWREVAQRVVALRRARAAEASEEADAALAARGARQGDGPGSEHLRALMWRISGEMEGERPRFRCRLGVSIHFPCRSTLSFRLESGRRAGSSPVSSDSLSCVGHV